MKILKPTHRELGAIVFTCQNCGCEFEADKHEYVVTGSAYIDNVLNCLRVKCICPCCKYPCTGTIYGDRE